MNYNNLVEQVQNVRTQTFNVSQNICYLPSKTPSGNSTPCCCVFSFVYYWHCIFHNSKYFLCSCFASIPLFIQPVYDFLVHAQSCLLLHGNYIPTKKKKQVTSSYHRLQWTNTVLLLIWYLHILKLVDDSFINVCK